MIDDASIEFAKILSDAVKKANERKEVVYVSYVEKIGCAKELSLYEWSSSFYEKERFFWQNADMSLLLMGFGSAVTLCLQNEKERFETIKEAGRKIFKSVHQYGTKAVSGTGALFFGGFSFADECYDECWSEFGQALFMMPKFMITTNQTSSYLTCNFVATLATDVTAVAGYINERKKIISALKNAQNVSKSDMPAVLEIDEGNCSAWLDIVCRAVEIIESGKYLESTLKKVVLARKLNLKFSETPKSSAVLRRLTEHEAGNFVFSLEYKTKTFIGATPERLVKKQVSTVLLDCLAGTIMRGVTKEEEQRVKKQILADEKNLHEHRYVVDFIYEKIKDLCKNIAMPSFPKLLSTPYVHHLHTPIKGSVSQSTHILDFVKQLHPTPAVGGTPQKEALLLIKELEKFGRGFYAAPIGWFDAAGDGEFAVGIRSGLIFGNQVCLFAGCGIVSDSVPSLELAETFVKFEMMMAAFGANK